MTAHGLELDASSIALAWIYLNGTDSALVHAVDRRLRSGDPVTADWIEEALGMRLQREETHQLSELMQRLDTVVDEFGRTSREAHTATKQYNQALTGHVGALDQANSAGVVISELATIAKAMLARTLQIERQMLLSEAQTRALKSRLETARRSAEEDHLTGLPNRRAFEAAFDSEYRQARSKAEMLCVAFCDIDNFKSINDIHGHEAGDRVLCLVAKDLAQIASDKCHVARHGGEEFVLLFYGDSPETAFAKLERLRRRLAQRKLINRATGVEFGMVTFSAGIADVFDCANPRAALKAADAALYRAKQDGRNRIVLAGPQDTEQDSAA